MCDRKECRFINIIEIEEGEKLYIHYADIGNPPIFIQYSFEDYLAEYEIKI